LLIILIKLYKLLISGFLPNSCRFTPSCSYYAIGALNKYGAIQGSWLTLKRIFKCHPFYKKSCIDPVP